MKRSGAPGQDASTLAAARLEAVNLPLAYSAPVDLSEKFDRVAEGFADAEYADAGYYNRRRAEAAFSLGPELPAGATVLDLGCGDASFAEEVLARGYRYLGVDPSGCMCEEARRRLGDRGTIEQGDFLSYEPREPVDATIVLRALYLAEDRVEVLRRIGGYTRTKIVFDLSGRQVPISRIAGEARLAGFDRLDTRPFFVSMRVVPPRLFDVVLRALERSGPLARAIASRRFRVFCAAYRSG
jgi:SAM-dependent methyltransferase